eukprot:2609976-Prymnesium_polylepis.1
MSAQDVIEYVFPPAVSPRAGLEACHRDSHLSIAVSSTPSRTQLLTTPSATSGWPDPPVDAIDDTTIAAQCGGVEGRESPYLPSAPDLPRHTHGDGKYIHTCRGVHQHTS